MKQGLHALQCMETLFLFQVVIPIQTIDLYNMCGEFTPLTTLSCHTYPNDKLLQPSWEVKASSYSKVVIPIQTISFYNLNIEFIQD